MAVDLIEAAVAEGVVRLLVGIGDDERLAAGQVIDQSLDVAQPEAAIDEHRLLWFDNQVHEVIAHTITVFRE